MKKTEFSCNSAPSEPGRHQSIGVVVGLCSHGLATVRALARGGVRVIALEANRMLPGAQTAMAQVEFINSINDDSLVEHLVNAKSRLSLPGKPVLLLTNDRMVRIVSSNWPRLEPHFSLAWSDCVETVGAFVSKRTSTDFFEQNQYPVPKTWIVRGNSDIEELLSDDQELIVKPIQPLGLFKAARAKSKEDIRSLIAKYPESLPFLVQEWIDGGDRDLFFCATVAKSGECGPLFVGRKLLSHPPAMGQTTSAETAVLPALQDLLRRFVADTKLSGPVSLEIKLSARDQSMRIIEPTVGRSDFWAALPIAAGIDLAQLEYDLASGTFRTQSEPPMDRVWFDTERDPLAYFKTVASPGNWRPAILRPVFPYLSLHDPRPFLAAAKRKIRRRLG